jgi:hypothetical protein
MQTNALFLPTFLFLLHGFTNEIVLRLFFERMPFIGVFLIEKHAKA